MPPGPASEAVTRFAIIPPETAPIGLLGARRDLAVSPDGAYVVYGGPSPDGGAQLNLRRMDQLSGAPLRGTENGTDPFFSHDSQWLGFTSTMSPLSLQKVSIFGGPQVTLTEAPDPILGASWAENDEIIFGTVNNGLFRVSGGGGQAEALTTPFSEQGETGHSWPSHISGRAAVVFVIAYGQPPAIDGQLAVLDLETGDVTHLGLVGVSPQYVSTGHLVYAVEDGSLRAVPFDTASLEVGGNPVPLVEDVGVKLSGAANYDVSDEGLLLHAVGGSVVNAQLSLAWVSRDGEAEPLKVPTETYIYPRLSPDGRRVALDARGDDNAIWIWDFEQQTRTRLLTGDGDATYPVWSPDGARLAFGGDRGVFYWKASNNTGEPEMLAEVPDHTGGPPASLYFFAPGAKGVVFRVVRSETRDDLGMHSLDGGTEPVWRLSGAFRERNAELSPDGQWMAYQSDESGEFEVFVRPFPEVNGGLVPISTNGGTEPLWSRDGRELFYMRCFRHQVLAQRA